MPYSYYKDTIIDLIDSADIIVGYNINFDLSFLLDDDYYHFLHSDSSKVIVDVMHLFSRVWGEWSSYYKSYKYQNLIKLLALTIMISDLMHMTV